MRLAFTRLAAAAACCAALSSCGSSSSSGLRFESFTVDSPAIGDNLLGDPASGLVTVLLPASYDASPDRRYPVAYYLHGFGESPGDIRSWSEAVREASGDGRELIVVGLQGGNRLGGAFYVDSQVTGKWEQWVTSEAIAAVDARYRTLATRASRALVGFSMGGFGAVNLGLRHPDLYCAVFAMAGGFFHPAGGLRNAMAIWASDSAFLTAYGATFAPDLSGSSPYARIPALDGSPADNAIASAWEAGFGDWTTKLQAYAALPNQLSAIRIEWADQDSYTWIPEGSAWLADQMEQQQLPVERRHFSGNHQLATSQVRDSLVPFLQEHLAF